jgi:hypothetical protein
MLITPPFLTDDLGPLEVEVLQCQVVLDGGVGVDADRAYAEGDQRGCRGPVGHDAHGYLGQGRRPARPVEIGPAGRAVAGVRARTVAAVVVAAGHERGEQEQHDRDGHQHTPHVDLHNIR